ncbi:glycoside hydrolase family 9 protein [Lachnospiraceae bacterium OttesenSCG-928-D06]|nr:glycoside hydrolase family 9 protein [Lachnospiraceae bacterium OttesenSCG-928-D06]
MYINIRKKAVYIAVFCIMLFLFTACEEEEGIKEVEIVKELYMEESPYLEYEIPEMDVNILVDLKGYEARGSKKVLFRNMGTQEVFHIVEQNSGDIVYEGEIKQKGYNKEQEEYNSYGEFSDFTQAGEYYIECDRLGQSYSFTIEEALYQQTLNELIMSLEVIIEEGTEEDRETLMRQIIILLLSYELYPDAFLDEDGNEIPDLMEVITAMIKELSKFQDMKSGCVENLNYTYAATLAKYSYIYQKYDNAYATEILNLADKAWRFAEGIRKSSSLGSESIKEADEAYRLLAATELYRGAGQSKYRNVIAQYQNNSGSVSGNDLLSEKYVVEQTLAKLTYISTKRKVDMELCTEFMKEIMLEVEGIADRASKSPYFAARNIEEDGAEALVWDIVLLSVVEYVISSHEYGLVIENQYHYLLGANEEAINYFDIQDNGILDAGLIMLLSAMIAV